MDSDFRIDLDELRGHLQRTQVVGFYFPFLRLTMLLDLRSNETDGPMVAVVPMVDTAEERVRSLKRLRPSFPRPDSLMLVPWPRLLGSFVRLGLWDLVEARAGEAGGDALRDRCREALAELHRAERRQVRNAITGDGYQTVWERG